MRVIVFFLAIIGASSSAHAAGMAYKCRTSNGTAVFSQMPCDASAKPFELKDATTVGASPNTIAAPVDATDVDSTAPSPPPPPPPPPSNSFRCEADNGMVFYRHEHCPATIAVPGVARVGGVAVEGEIRYRVSERSVPRSSACQAIQSRDADKRDGSGYDESYSPYERREGRDPCGT